MNILRHVLSDALLDVQASEIENLTDIFIHNSSNYSVFFLA